jgi:hypothetical protein
LACPSIGDAYRAARIADDDNDDNGPTSDSSSPQHEIKSQEVGRRALALELLGLWVKSETSTSTSSSSKTGLKGEGGLKGGKGKEAALGALWKHFSEATNSMTDRAGALRLCANLDDCHTIKVPKETAQKLGLLLIEEKKKEKQGSGGDDDDDSGSLCSVSLRELALASFEDMHREHREAIDIWFTVQVYLF